MNVTKKQSKSLKLTSQQSKLLFNYFDATNQMKHFKKLREDLKDDAVMLVDDNGGQVFLNFKGKNIFAEIKRKEYKTIDLEKLKNFYPNIYESCKVKTVKSVTLDVKIK